MSQTAAASEVAPPLIVATMGWQNLTSTFLWVIGPLYIFIALKKCRVKMRTVDKQASVSWLVVASYALSGFVLLSIPFTQRAQSGQPPSFIEFWLDKVPNESIYPIIAASVFFPLVLDFLHQRLKKK